MALTYGDSGAGVEALQVQLRGLGYAIDVDGVFGDQTKIVVAHFQRAVGLAVDGMVGDATIRGLYAATARGWRTDDNSPWESASNQPTNPAGDSPGLVEDAARVAAGASKIPGVVWIGLIAGVIYYLYRKGVFGKGEE